MYRDFPYRRLAVNVIGTFLLCFIIAGAFRTLSAHKDVQDIVTTGFLGSFTTFSALSVETVLLVENNQFILAGLYVLMQYHRWTFCRGTWLSSRQEEGAHMTSIDFLMIGIGGFFGAIIRYFISTIMNRPGEIPRGTLVVNLAGALLIGFIFGMEIPRMWTLLFASGLAGALTTFSTMNKELIELWRNGEKKSCFTVFPVIHMVVGSRSQ